MANPHASDTAETAKDRVWIPLVLPLVAVALTAALIVGIGETLLAFDGILLHIGHQEIVTPVLIAFAMTVIVLVGATVAATMWAKDES